MQASAFVQEKESKRYAICIFPQERIALAVISQWEGRKQKHDENKKRKIKSVLLLETRLQETDAGSYMDIFHVSLI